MMNLNQFNNERENVIAQAYWKKIEKLSLQLFILRNKEDILSDKINKKESQLNETRVKYEAIKERQERKAAERMERKEAMKKRKAVEKMEKEEAMKERHERKAVEKMEKEEAMKERQERKAVEKMEKEEAMKERKAAERMSIKELHQTKKHVSTAIQLQVVSEFSNEYIIALANNNDISTENLFRQIGYSMQQNYPSGWDIPTFKKRFIQDFGSTNWLKGMNNQSNSISSAFYRMCPQSETSRSSKTGKLTSIPSFKKTEGGKAKYIFDANLYLNYC
jgi:ATPase subunit of ABC transporter with duplicated ATPase domains